MRRRRRTPTRIVKRKSTNDQSPVIIDSNKGKGKRIFFSFSLIIILAAISYFSYSHFFALEMENLSLEQPVKDNTVNADTIISEEPTPDPVEIKQPEKMIQIEVLNGCGQKGIAKIFKSYLRQNGFDVVNTDNYRVRGKIFWNVEKSKVIDQIGKTNYAEEVAESLGIDDQYVSSVENPSPICDVTVVVGKDYKKLKSFQDFSK